MRKSRKTSRAGSGRDVADGTHLGHGSARCARVGAAANRRVHDERRSGSDTPRGRRRLDSPRRSLARTRALGASRHHDRTNITLRDASSHASNVAAVAEDTSRRPREPLPWSVRPLAHRTLARGGARRRSARDGEVHAKSTRRVASARARLQRAENRNSEVERRHAKQIRKYLRNAQHADVAARAACDASSSASARHLTSHHITRAMLHIERRPSLNTPTSVRRAA